MFLDEKFGMDYLRSQRTFDATVIAENCESADVPIHEVEGVDLDEP